MSEQEKCIWGPLYPGDACPYSAQKEITRLRAEVERLETELQLVTAPEEACGAVALREKQRAEQLQAKLDAVAELPERWRKDYETANKGFTCCHEDCADELEQLLGEENGRASRNGHD